MKRLGWAAIVIVGLLIVSVSPSPVEAQRGHPAYKPPIYKPPIYKPPIYKPPVDVYKPPIDVYKPPIYKPPIDVYKPPKSYYPGEKQSWPDIIGRPNDPINSFGRGSFSGGFSLNPSVDLLKRQEEARIKRQAEVQEKQITVDATIREVADLAEKGRWGAAADRADRTLAGTNTYPEVSTGPLLQFARLKRGAEAIDRVESLMRSDAAQDLDADTAKALSPSLRMAYRDYHNLIVLSKKADGHWESQVPDLDDMLATLSSLRSSPVSRAIAKNLARELAVKAFLSAHPAEANRLLDVARDSGDEAPTGKDKTHADALLRDVQAVILGEGKVETWAAVQALLPRPDESNHPIRGPPAMVPADDAHGYRPPVVEKATEGLPSPVVPLIPIVAEKRQEAEQATKQVRNEQEREQRAALAYARDYKPSTPLVYPSRIGNGIGGIGTDDDEKRKNSRFKGIYFGRKGAYLGDPIAEVEKVLGRKLKDDERELARTLLESNSKPEDIAATIKATELMGDYKPSTPLVDPYRIGNGMGGIGTDDDEKRKNSRFKGIYFGRKDAYLGDPIAEVEKVLGRKLKDDERELARTLLGSNSKPEDIAATIKAKKFRRDYLDP